jgi:hypothetical protein
MNSNRRFPPPWSIEELDNERRGRTASPPSLWAVSRNRHHIGHFGPATILNLYRIAHSESTVDKWDNSPSAIL